MAAGALLADYQHELAAYVTVLADAVVKEGDVLVCDVRILKGTNASPVASGDDELLHLPTPPSGSARSIRSQFDKATTCWSLT